MSRQAIIEAYLDYINNYVTVEKWAEHMGLHLQEAKIALLLMRQVFSNPHPEA